MKRIFIILFCFTASLLSTNFANSGDFAERKIYGFSPDGSLFTFEEYGIQDGSSFPYSNIYVVDTTTDEWTAGSPYRVRLEDETKGIFDAREEARILAGSVMKSFEERGNIVATYRATQFGINTKTIAANPRIVVPPIDDPVEFRLEEIAFSASEVCTAFGASKGFKLIKVALKDGETTRTLHKDEAIPSSRNCPLQYDFADLITYFPENNSPVFAILIRMQTVGFEGPDARYLAVTGNLN